MGRLWSGEGRDALGGDRDVKRSGRSSREGAMGGCRGELRSAPPYKKNWAKPLILGVQGAAPPF